MEDRLHMQVYVKPTDAGECMKANSECPDRYKRSVINNYLTRAYKVSSSWNDFDLEIQRIKQLLINNGYTNNMVDFCLNKFLNYKFSDNHESLGPSSANDINLFYKSQMHTNYKIEEKIIKKIIRDKVKPLKKDSKLKFNIYYNNQTTHNLIMKNGPINSRSKLKQSNVVYKFTCPYHQDTPHCYIGHTRTLLARRLTMHVQGGCIKEHLNILQMALYLCLIVLP